MKLKFIKCLFFLISYNHLIGQVSTEIILKEYNIISSISEEGNYIISTALNEINIDSNFKVLHINGTYNNELEYSMHVLPDTYKIEVYSKDLILISKLIVDTIDSIFIISDENANNCSTCFSVNIKPAIIAVNDVIFEGINCYFKDVLKNIDTLVIYGLLKGYGVLWYNDIVLDYRCIDNNFETIKDTVGYKDSIEVINFDVTKESYSNDFILDYTVDPYDIELHSESATEYINVSFDSINLKSVIYFNKQKHIIYLYQISGSKIESIICYKNNKMKFRKSYNYEFIYNKFGRYKRDEMFAIYTRRWIDVYSRLMSSYRGYSFP